MLAVQQTEHGVLEVVRVGGSDVDNVDVCILYQIFVGSVCGCREGAFAGFEELLCAGAGGGRGSCGDSVLYIGDVAGRGVEHQVFGEFCEGQAGKASASENEALGGAYFQRCLRLLAIILVSFLEDTDVGDWNALALI